MTRGVKLQVGARWGVLAVGGAAVVGLVVGTGAGALWGIGVPSTNEAHVVAGTAPHFSQRVNASGQTYGSLLGAATPPDLVQVVATNGQTGYVSYAQLQSASGGDVTTPQEAVAWDQHLAAVSSISIPVYLSDGTTRIGTFDVSGGSVTSVVAQSNAAG